MDNQMVIFDIHISGWYSDYTLPDVEQSRATITELKALSSFCKQ